jgi:hypothetical protein
MAGKLKFARYPFSNFVGKSVNLTERIGMEDKGHQSALIQEDLDEKPLGGIIDPEADHAVVHEVAQEAEIVDVVIVLEAVQYLALDRDQETDIAVARFLLFNKNCSKIFSPLKCSSSVQISI